MRGKELKHHLTAQTFYVSLNFSLSCFSKVVGQFYSKLPKSSSRLRTSMKDLIPKAYFKKVQCLETRAYNKILQLYLYKFATTVQQRFLRIKKIVIS